MKTFCISCEREEVKKGKYISKKRVNEQYVELLGVIEKKNSAAGNITLIMERNGLEIRNKEITKGYKEQEIPQKAQDKLRKLIDEDYRRWWRKRWRKWGKLQFWLEII